jgi:hypothetical protein
MEPLEVIEGRAWLGFAGIASPSLYMIHREHQFAEKLHAYTLPRKGVANTRVRDLVDMVLLIQSGTLDKAQVGKAIRLTFDRRGTQTLPETLLHPPIDWQKPFEALAKECRLSEGIDSAYVALDKFLNEVGTPGDRDRGSGLIVISIPDDRDQDSGVIVITLSRSPER